MKKRKEGGKKNQIKAKDKEKSVSGKESSLCVLILLFKTCLITFFFVYQKSYWVKECLAAWKPAFRFCPTIHMGLVKALSTIGALLLLHLPSLPLSILLCPRILHLSLSTGEILLCFLVLVRQSA